MPKRKPFDKNLYDQYDKLAKKYAINILELSGYKVRGNAKKTGVDLIVSDKNNNDLFFVEVEIKRYIKAGESFSFDTLHVPHRKAKYCGLDKPTLFILFSECGKSYLCVWDNIITASPIKEVENKYVTKGEVFFDVPMNHVDDSIDKALKRNKK